MKNTKCIVIGQQPKKTTLKPIEFDVFLSANNVFCPTDYSPDEYAFIELICKNYLDNDNTHRDLMFVYDDFRNEGVLIIGSWNDGVVK